MRNAKSTRNDNIRKEIGGIVTSAKNGSIIFTTELVAALSIRDRAINERNINRLLRERDDVKLINLNTWQVNKCV